MSENDSVVRCPYCGCIAAECVDEDVYGEYALWKCMKCDNDFFYSEYTSEIKKEL